MTDIFFSYKREDLEQITHFYNALERIGYNISWDQKIPPGQDWDTWIKGELGQSRAVVVFWTPNSIGTNNVQHEARIAHKDGKLIQVLLTPLEIKQYPLGLDSQQAIELAGWNGDASDPAWKKLLSAIEAKTTPGWVQNRLAALEAALKSERQNREMIETRANSLDAQMRIDAKSASDAIQELDAHVKDLTAQRQEIEDILAIEKKQSAELNEDLNGSRKRIEEAQRVIGSMALEREDLKAKKPDHSRIRMIAGLTLAIVMGNTLSYYTGSPFNNFTPWNSSLAPRNATTLTNEAGAILQADTIAKLTRDLAEQKNHTHTLHSEIRNLTKQRDDFKRQVDRFRVVTNETCLSP